MGHKNAVIASGHEASSEAAAEVLRDGGNAYDAVIAAFFAACVAEPVLASVAGGGFLMSAKATGQVELLDFFTQTPSGKQAEGLDFYEICGDFGATTQAFHVGMAAMAVPGALAGMFEIHRQHGSRPMRALLQPAIRLARDGVKVNDFQSYVIRILAPVLSARTMGETFHNPEGQLLAVGELQTMPEFADFLETLAIEGEDLFYRGEVSAMIDRLSREQGGHIRRGDMESYRVVRREPVRYEMANHRVYLNPLPSLGGTLIHYGLSLFERYMKPGLDREDPRFWQLLLAVMDMSQLSRQKHALAAESEYVHILAMHDELQKGQLDRFFAERQMATRGTTHISIIDATGNAVAMTVSNGECNAHVLKGSGILLNNMLGEEDLNPGGFHAWQENLRLSSMMSPTLLRSVQGDVVALGSGGSNRIRTVILQLLINLVHFGMSLEDAVHAPRIHSEAGGLNIEAGLSPECVTALLGVHPDAVLWDDRSLYFGGAHAVTRSGKGQVQAVGDPRRGGVALRV